jgi:hypothetical protein
MRASVDAVAEYVRIVVEQPVKLDADGANEKSLTVPSFF